MPPIVSTPVPRDQRRFVPAARDGRRDCGRLEARLFAPGLFYAEGFQPGPEGTAPAERGARKYVGSTDLRNEAMQRVFLRIGCEVTGTQGFFAYPSRASGRPAPPSP